MNTVTANPSDGSDETSKVIAEVFKKLPADQKHYAAFDEAFRLVLKSIHDESSVNPIADRATLIDPEDPEMGTLWEWLVERSTELLRAYIGQLNDYHSKDFARAYMLSMFEGEDDDSDRCAAKAYLSLSDLDDVAMYNPKYAEAFLWALRSGKSEIYAAHFSRGIAENDLICGISDFEDRAKKYSEAYDACLKEDKSPVYAHTYAKNIVDQNGLSTGYEEIHAEFYERLLKEGYSHNGAVDYADMYAEEFGAKFSTLEEEDGIQLSDIIPALAKKVTQNRTR